MKIPITDQFLWDVYSVLEKGGHVFAGMFGSRRSIIKILPHNYNPIFERYRKKHGKENFSKLIHYLKRKDYIKSESLKSSNAILLTKKGLGKALNASFFADTKVKRKDGKWIMLMFDIPQNHHKARALLGSVLYNLGYKMFQQSVWVTPYDVSEKTERLLKFHSLDGYVKIFLIEEI